MSQMNEALKIAEEEAIKEVTLMVKNYFQNHHEAVIRKDLTINKIEDLLLETKTNTISVIKLIESIFGNKY